MIGPDRSEPLGPDPVATAEPNPSLPAPSPGPQPRRWRKAGSVTAEVVLTGLVLAFAFLVSSFVARNADFWLHLATGRLLAQGGYAFGVDPFAYTTAGVYWVNHNWLYDWALFRLYGLIGDAGLVVVKAALIAVLAGVMLSIRQPGRSGWLPALCTALAVLAMSPRLLLQPSCISLLLLGVTLWLLWRSRGPEGPPAQKILAFGWQTDDRIWLFPLFALWVNLDDWFLLGPVLVCLFWVGDRMRRPARPTPMWLLPACLLACLCSPHHVFVFTLPADLYPLPFSGALLWDVRFQRLTASPWQFDAAFHSPAGSNIAGLAYFALVLLGVASFIVDRSALRDWRILVWAAFAALGAWQARLIPLFAVIGGPVAVLNLQRGKAEIRGAALFGLRAACLAVLIGLIALAVPGWLHGFHQRTWQVAWGVEVDSSLKRAAETLHEWRTSGRLGDQERSFAVHPDAACYCAWFAPGEQCFLDPRLPLFSGETSDSYALICCDFDPAATPVPGAPDLYRDVLIRNFDENGVAVVLVYDPDPQRTLSLLARTAAGSRVWTLLSVDGQAALFGWYPVRAHRFAALKFDPRRLAFSDDGAAPGRAPSSPGATPLFARPPVPSWESAAATAYLRLFADDLLPGRRQAVDKYYLTAVGGYAGLAGLAPDGAAVACRYAELREALPELGDKPPDLPLLAVRAARRAVADDPDDANAYLRLAQAYLALRNETAEHSRGGGLTPLAMLRHVQIATALNQALVVNPDLEAAHAGLADLFLEQRYFDAALDHRRAQLQLSRRAGRRPSEDAAGFQGRIADLDAKVQSLEKAVQDANDLCKIRFASLGDDPLGKSQAALDLGLAETALDDVLMSARVEVYGSAVAKRELELLLWLGRAREAKDLLDDEAMRANKLKLATVQMAFGDSPKPTRPYVFPTYEWLLACAAAAAGDYDPADAALEEIGGRLEQQEKTERDGYADLVPLAAGSGVGGLAGGGPAPFPLLAIENRELQDRMLLLEAQRADVLTLRALLDLERGAPSDVRKRLDESAVLARPVRESGAPVPGEPLTRFYLRRLHEAGD